MNQGEIRNFVDCMTYEDCTVRLGGKVFWCLGVTHDAETGVCHVGVWECDPDTFDFTENKLNFTGCSTEECMRHFLEDKYWNGRAFHEVAPELEWIDP